MYAINPTQNGWRSVSSVDDLLEGETFSQNQPALVTDPKDAIKAQIASLEQSQLMPRATREFMLMFMEANATPEILAANFGYQAVKAFDLQIKALRDQL